MSSPFLRRALAVDAVASAATALLTILAAGPLAELLGLPSPLLRGVGFLLIPFVALVAWAALRERAPAAAVRTIVALNALWVAASLGLLWSGAVDPTTLGTAFVLGQALAVAILAELQIVGLRRTTSVGSV